MDFNYQLLHLVYSGSYDLICICETWLNDTVLSSELLPGYLIFRRDRVGKTGGGVLVAIKSNIRAIRCTDLQREDLELCATKQPFCILIIALLIHVQM